MPEKNSRIENLKDNEKEKATVKASNSKKTNTTGKKNTTSKTTSKTTKAPEKTATSKTKKVVEKDNKPAKTSTTKSATKTTAKSTTSKGTKATSKTETKPKTDKVAETKASNAKTSTSKVSTSKVSVAKPKEDTKKTVAKSNSKSTTKKTTAQVAKKTDAKELEEKKKTVEAEEIKPKESAIISKIKSFLKKIVELQEEAKKEKLEQKEKEAKELAKKENKEIEKEKQNTYNLEYYDLPYRYNETVVKILAQTPKRLFVYWDVADSDRERYIKAFGENFFNDTYPVLLIHNEDKNYTFEVPINDFANSWYLDINDSKSKYTIQLGRKFRDQAKLVTINKKQVKQENIVLQNDYLPITTSNTLEVPNDHILFENLKPYVIYRNVKDYQEKVVDISNLEFAKKMGKIYNIYEVYKEIYKKEMEEESLLDLLNPSSMSSSSFK